jgi:Zn-dependent protease
MLIVSGLLLGLPFGFAATPINPANLRNRRNAEVYVAMAGPAANLLLAIVGAIVYRVVVGHAPVHGDLVSIIVYLFVTWNVLLALLNCLPVPPLDGAALLWRVLSPRQVWQLRPILNQYGILIVVAVFFGLSSYISPLLYGVTDALVGV